MFTTLVTTEQVAANIRQWRIVDCRFDLRDPSAGRRAYLSEHIPGAVFADLEQDLSGTITPAAGRHPLPDRERLAKRLGELGIGDDTQVIAYDDQSGAFAARLWWLLRWIGHAKVAVLDGGLSQWRAQARPTETGEVDVLPADLSHLAPLQTVATTEDILAERDDPRFVLLDARAPERYRGEVEPIDPVAGHVPGAVNYPFQENLAARGCFHPAGELRRRFGALLNAHRVENVAVMCGSGVTACHHLLALEVAGLPGARLYAGSWSEWIRDPARPIARGAEK